VASTAFAFVIKMCEQHKSTSLSVIQVNNWQKTISTEEKSDIISQLEKGEQIVYICCRVKKKEIMSVSCNIRFTQNSVHIICDNAELQEVLHQELQCLCSQTTTVLSKRTIPKTWM
jgi:hypothetical protein